MAKQYTAKDYISAVFDSRQTDRIPVRTMQSFSRILDQAGVTGKEVLTQPDKYVKALATLWEILPSDALTILAVDPALLAEIGGLTFQEAKALGPGNYLLEDKSSLNKLKVRKAHEYPRLEYFREICEKASNTLPDVVIDVTTLSPWSGGMMLRGMENVIYDTADDADYLHELLRFTTDLAKMIGEMLVKTGIGMITIGDPSAGCSVISPDMFREWVKPYLQELIHHLKENGSIPVILHICGYTDPIMEDLVSLGVDGLSIDAPASLEKLVKISDKSIVIEGNFPGELYIEGTREQIEEKVKESIDIASKANGYRYILCSGCQVPDTAPLENVRIFLEAGHRYGKRPLVS